MILTLNVLRAGPKGHGVKKIKMEIFQQVEQNSIFFANIHIGKEVSSGK